MSLFGHRRWTHPASPWVFMASVGVLGLAGLAWHSSVPEYLDGSFGSPKPAMRFG